MQPVQRVGKSRCLIINQQDDAKTVIINKNESLKLTRDTNLIYMQPNVNEVVGNWLEQNTKWKEQPVWKPKEHPDPHQKLVMLTTKELGNSKDLPMEIEDTEYIIEKEVVTDHGIIKVQYKWDELTDEEKDKCLIEWMGKDYKEFL